MSYITSRQAQIEPCPFMQVCINEDDVIQRGAVPIYVHQVCKGDQCKIGWRDFGFPCDDAWREAVVKAAEELGDKTPSRKTAADYVNKNRAKYGLSTDRLGYCGAFGKPA